MDIHLTNKKFIISALTSVVKVTKDYYFNPDFDVYHSFDKNIYNKLIVDNYFSINTTFNEVDYIISLLERINPISISAEDFDELKYHIKNYIIRVISLQDLAKNIINNTYRLGISERKCTIDLLRDNIFTKKSNALSILSKIHKDIDNFRHTRNQIIHHGIFKNDKIELLYELSLMKGDFREPDFDVNKIEKLLNDNFSDLIMLLKNTRNELMVKFDQLLDSLEDIYNLKILEFKEEI